MILVKLKWGALWPEASPTIAIEQSAEIGQSIKFMLYSGQ